MAEAILSGVVKWTIGQLGDAAVKKVASSWGVEDELEQLETTISTIKSVLVDAEKKQVQNEQIKTWLMDLEDAVYDADDLANEFSAEALRRQAMSTGNALVKQVRTFCSTSNQFAFRHKMGKKIRDLRKKLVAIADDRKFHLETGLQEPKVVTGVITYRVREEDVIGRDDEKMEIIERLFEIKTDEENINIGVIPIVGVGGLGKTTLAQLVVNDAKVKDHFKPITWVNVPKVFDVELVVKEMVKSGVKDERSMDQLEKEIEEKIKGKLYLIVLDDVWDFGNREKWLKLENLLRDGAKGSKIIVTTRDKNVAHKINGQKESTHFLRTLDEEKSWSLFKKLAFMQGQEPDNLAHVKTGREIMNKCGGIPLVIRTIAGMLYTINLEEWSSFKEEELSAIRDYHDDVIPTLKLSYDRLPSHLKHCFGYCSLFPKNYVFDVERLIDLWMAQGYIKLSNDPQENMGYQHFKDLLYKSFFDEVEIDDDSFKVTKCKMHDCMHDLAMSVTGSKCCMLSLNDKEIHKTTRHISLDFSFWSLEEEESLSLLVKMEKIRTLFFVTKRGYSLSTRILEKSILSCKFLRTLDLDGARLTIIPKSIGKLKHLRYLDLSCNHMQALPNSIARLQNLQTLNLSYCWELTALPDSISSLQNLQTLNLSHCYCLGALPVSISRLQNLQTLNLSKCWNLTALPDSISRLQNLQTLNLSHCYCLGALPVSISRLQNLQTLNLSNCRDLIALPDSISTLQNLQTLNLSNCYCVGALSDSISGLQNLHTLNLSHCYSLGALPDSISRLQNLQTLNLSKCGELRALPDSISRLQNLQTLNLLGCVNLSRCWKLNDIAKLVIRNPGIKNWSGSTLHYRPPGLFHLIHPELGFDLPIPPNWNSDSRFVLVFSKLENLEIEDAGDLKHLPLWFKNFTSLKKLSVSKCSKLQSLSPGLHHLTSLQQLSISWCDELDISNGDRSDAIQWQHLGSLSELSLIGLPKLIHLPVWFKSLTSLAELSIINCSKLQSLSPDLHHLTALQKLDICWCEELDMSNGDGGEAILWQHLGSLSSLWLTGLPKLVALPQGLQQVTSLQEIIIFGCKNLESVLEHITNLKSLKKISIQNCPNLKSLPEGIDCLPSLEKLKIEDCPILLERCRKDNGDYWAMISHIPWLELSPMTEEKQNKPDQLDESTSSKTSGLF